MSEQEQISNCVTERRLGRFRLSRWALESAPDETLARIFAGMVIARAEYDWPSNSIHYVAYAPQFEPVRESEEPHPYSIELTWIDGDLVVKAIPHDGL